jgi:hypothetical protein
MPEQTKGDRRAQPWKKAYMRVDGGKGSGTIIMETAEDDGGDQAGG